MCGICCICSSVPTHGCAQFDWTEFIEKNSRLGRRGPDCSHSTQVVLDDKGRQLFFQGHVLHLRGEMTPQPLQDHHGNTLLWNGEIFGGLQVSEGENDTQVLMRQLSSCDDPCHLLTTMAKVQGPWALVYWQAKTRCLWFGRDMFGRRSLLWHLPQHRGDPFILSSTQIGDQIFQEIPSVGMYCVHFPEVRDDGDLDIHLYVRENAVWPGSMDRVELSQTLSDKLCGGQPETLPVNFSLDKDLKFLSHMPQLNKTVPNIASDHENKLPNDLDCKQSGSTAKGVIDHQKFIEDLIQSDHAISKLADQLLNVLQRAVKTRIYNQPDLVSEVKTSNDFVAEVKTSPCSRCEHCPVSPKMCEADGSSDICYQQVDDMTNKPCDVSDTVLSDTGECSYSSAQDNQREHVRDQDRAKVAILFSGGVDSAVITALADRCLPESEPIDLINVAFEQQIKAPNKGKANAIPDEKQKWNVPDRQTGYSALTELNPRRKWNFVEVNVSLPELRQVRSDHVRHLVYPLDTVLDDSIGCAVWFAARGEGVLGNGAHRGTTYTSNSRVILCGMGADEQLAGYSRHRGRFGEVGWQGLLDEVELEITRISARNLGRDDRIITDHSKESRFPFLDENVVEFLSSVPIQYKANLDLPRGLGEKLLLRVCASKLGLRSTAVLPKRAIQFGSRIAKMENSKEKASDKCQRLAD